MRKLILLVIILNLFLPTQGFSQKVSRVYYKTTAYQKKDLNEIENIGVRNRLKKIIEAKEKITYTLTFNKYKSKFELVDQLDFDKSVLNELSRGPKKSYYKNLKTKENIKSTKSLGETVNVLLPFNRFKWVVTNETKRILNFDCYKATAVYEEYNPLTKSNSKFNITAWFSPELPFPFGPSGIDGLPGLVLEGTMNGQNYFYATKIELNKYESDKIKIQKEKGKQMSIEEFNETLLKITQGN